MSKLSETEKITPIKPAEVDLIWLCMLVLHTSNKLGNSSSSLKSSKKTCTVPLFTIEKDLGLKQN